jgi:N-acetyl-anhydromuramyl-L-alanine amidase AmpD
VALQIDLAGMVMDARVLNQRAPTIERGVLKDVKGIVVHQTDAQTAAATFSAYKKSGANGAHFLIDKNGMIYQTASVRHVTHHVGSIRPRCLAEFKCSPAAYKGVDPGKPTHRIEVKKQWPERYPTNFESIGIELVGRAEVPPDFVPKTDQQRKMDKEQLRGEVGVYETPTAAQNISLKWLVDQLLDTMQISPHEVFRHPVVSWKNPNEARGARWY